MSGTCCECGVPATEPPADLAPGSPLSPGIVPLHPMIEFFAIGTAVLPPEQEIAPEKIEDRSWSVND